MKTIPPLPWLDGFREWTKLRTDAELEELEKNWVQTAVECGDVQWLKTFGYDKNGKKINE